jgi:hypothetical protein
MIDNDPDNVPEGNQRRIEFLLVISKLPKISTSDLPALRKRFYDYLDLCVKYNMKVGNMAAYAAMGVDKNTVNDWESGRRRSSQKEYQEFAREIKRVCGMYREMMMQDGAIYPATGIFWQKNYDGLQDQQEIITATKDPLGENMTQKEIEDRFSADFVEIDDFKEVKEPEQLIEPVQTKPRREKKQAKETE